MRWEQDKPYILFLADQQDTCHQLNAISSLLRFHSLWDFVADGQPEHPPLPPELQHDPWPLIFRQIVTPK